jgi:hypothetical protein
VYDPRRSPAGDYGFEHVVTRCVEEIDKEEKIDGQMYEVGEYVPDIRLVVSYEDGVGDRSYDKRSYRSEQERVEFHTRSEQKPHHVENPCGEKETNDFPPSFKSHVTPLRCTG